MANYIAVLKKGKEYNPENVKIVDLIRLEIKRKKRETERGAWLFFINILLQRTSSTCDSRMSKACPVTKRVCWVESHFRPRHVQGEPVSPYDDAGHNFAYSCSYIYTRKYYPFLLKKGHRKDTQQTLRLIKEFY